MLRAGLLVLLGIVLIGISIKQGLIDQRILGRRSWSSRAQRPEATGSDAKIGGIVGIGAGIAAIGLGGLEFTRLKAGRPSLFPTKKLY